MTPDEIREPADLDGLDKDGLIAFLKSDNERKIKLWNDWRKANHWKPIDLARADLREANLERADLSGAHLEEAILFRACLDMAWLVETHLEDANLFEAHLKGSRLDRARLQRANLFFAHLEGANLSGARLEGANLVGAYLDEADVRRAHLREVPLSSASSLRGIKLYQAYLWGMLSLRHDQFLDEKGNSTIWEETEERFSEAKDVYKTLKGYFEDAGDYEGANWAYVREKQMEKRTYAPKWARRLFYGQKDDYDKGHPEAGKPYPVCCGRWATRLAFEALCNYGVDLWRPAFWLLAVIVGFASIYLALGMVTASPECAYTGLERPEWCAPTRNFVDNLLFSLGAMTTTEVGEVWPYRARLGLLMTLEALVGIALTGLLGFVLGNKLRYS